jgi:hypothetical protein
MREFKSARVCYLVLALATAVLVSSACGSSTTQKLSDAVQQPTATALASVAEPPLTPTLESKPTVTPQPAEPLPTPTLEAEPTSTPQPTEPLPTPTLEAEPTSTPQPTEPPPTPTPEPEAIKLTMQGFGQDGRQLGFAFLVDNPNAGFAIEDLRYQIAAYDEAGAVAETDSGFITLLLPDQTLGVGGTMFLDEGITVSRIEVQLGRGDTVATDLIPAFTVNSVAYYPGQYSSSATGIVSSPYNRDITNVRVSAVAYNKAGEITGGGFTFLNFILANSTSGVDVSVTSAGDVAKVELYPSISGLSLLALDKELPTGANDLMLAKQGFGQDERQAGFGMLIENPNNDFSVEHTQYHLTAFAEDGKVLAVEEGYVEVLLPKQTLGIGGSIFLEEGMMIARMDIQIKAGDFEEIGSLPFFTAENVNYQAGQFSSKVTGEIVSPYTQDITNVRVSAIAYNDAREIIGGGFTFLDFVPANGKAAVDVSVTTSETPQTAELYAAVSGLSDFK